MARVPSLLVPEQAFAQLPSRLREDLLGSFEEIVRNYSEGRWGPAELDGELARQRSQPARASLPARCPAERRNRGIWSAPARR